MIVMMVIILQSDPHPSQIISIIFPLSVVRVTLNRMKVSGIHESKGAGNEGSKSAMDLTSKRAEACLESLMMDADRHHRENDSSVD